MLEFNREEQGEGEVSYGVIREIAGSVGWTKFIAIAGIVLISLGVLALLGGLFTFLGYSGGMFGGILILLFIYAVLLGFMIYLYVVLLQCSNKYQQFAQSNNMRQLEEALVLDKKFWQMFGIFIIVGFVLSIIMSMILPFMMMSMMGGMPGRF